MMTTKEQIYSAEYGDCNLTVTWRRSSDPKFLACCKQRIDGVEVVIQGSNIHIQSIVHEAHHAVDWLSALGVINGRENQASECGIIVEEIMAAHKTYTSVDELVAETMSPKTIRRYIQLRSNIGAMREPTPKQAKKQINAIIRSVDGFSMWAHDVIGREKLVSELERLKRAVDKQIKIACIGIGGQQLLDNK
jgi:hypothetical protein